MSPSPPEKDCPLCRAQRITSWHFEDEDCWIADCMICATPMVVWRTHGIPETVVERRLLDHLAAVARQRYPDGFWIDPRRRRIPDHWHAHARPEGGFFDPASERFGSWHPDK